MRKDQFSTLDLPPQHQLAAWRAWFDPVFDVILPSDDSKAGFQAEAQLCAFGPAMLSTVKAPRLHVRRGERNLRRDAVDHWNIVVGNTETRLIRPGARTRIPARTPFVVSLGEAMESEREADTRMQLYLPRDSFPLLAPILDRARGIPIQGAIGQLLSDYLKLLERSLPELPEAELPRLANPIQAMIAACVAPTVATLETASGQVDLTRLEQIRQTVRRRLGSATLNAATLCRDVGISRSQLYRLLEGEGGVIRYIQRLRLQASYAALSNPQEMRSVARIAEAYGFYDHSTFSRAFRRDFGITPTELRIAARTGAVPVLANGPVMDVEIRTLCAYLRDM